MQNITDQDIVMDMLKDSKFTLHSLSVALTECTHPQLRELLTNQLNECVDNHFKLSDLAVRKKWYQAQLNPKELIQQDLTSVQGLI